jgi:dihydroxy-acid dehydratase
MFDEKSGRQLRSRALVRQSRQHRHDALYLERYLKLRAVVEELQSAAPSSRLPKPDQTSAMQPPPPRARRAGARRHSGRRGIPLEVPVHSIQETGKRPTAGLDRNWISGTGGIALRLSIDGWF